MKIINKLLPFEYFFLIKKRINPRRVFVGINYIKLSDLNLRLSRVKHSFFLEGLNYARLLHTADFIFYNESDQIFCKTTSNIVHAINSWEEIFILYELYIKGEYAFKFNSDFFVFDIGSNVGFTSLYFSNYKNCVGVEGFEPFPRTYENLTYNLSLNKENAKKINVNNYGLGNTNQLLKVEYCYELKGSNSSLNSLPDWVKKSGAVIDNVEIEIRDLNELAIKMLSIKKSNSSLKILVKLDCEGAEYDILSEISQRNLFSYIDAIVIEYHYKGSKEISTLLLSNGFIIISNEFFDKGFGLLYGIKS